MPLLNEPLDVLGQQPALNALYTQLCLCFPVDDDSLHSSIIERLTDGLKRLSAGFPWIAGQVVNENGVFKIISLESSPYLVVKDLRHDSSIPTMDTLRRANFPFSMLDESVICPRNTLTFPGSSHDSNPVFLVQVNFVTGGLLLSFVGQHNVMDMTGQGQIMYLLSKACHGEEFTSEELSSGNLDGRKLIPFLDDSYKPGPELEYQIPPSSPPVPTPEGTASTSAPPPPPHCTWAYFTFSGASLAALKSVASKTVTSGYVSTDDVLTAAIWQSVMRARLPRLDPNVDVHFARAVDPRRYLGIPPNYAGIAQNMTYQSRPLRKLLDEPVGTIAAQFRAAVDPDTSDMAFRTRALVTMLSRAESKNGISVTARIDTTKDIMLSSWANQKTYELDFNLGLGRPECVRRPQFTPVESLFYLIPKSPDGEIAAALCLRDEDLERLRADEEFVKYAEYIG